MFSGVADIFLVLGGPASDVRGAARLLPDGEVLRVRDGFRESIIRLGVKVDNGLEKLNQGLKKAEKVKNSDQTLGSNLQTSVRATRSQRREARVRPVHSRTRLAFLRKNYAATSFVEEAASLNFCLFR